MRSEYLLSFMCNDQSGLVRTGGGQSAIVRTGVHRYYYGSSKQTGYFQVVVKGMTLFSSIHFHKS